MVISSQDSGEGSDPDESSQQSMETEIIMCFKEIHLSQRVAKKSNKWYKDYGFEEMDNANFFVIFRGILSCVVQV